MHKVINVKDDLGRFYVSKKGRRGLASFEVFIDAIIRGLEEYTKKIPKRLTTKASESSINRNNNDKQKNDKNI